MMPQSTPNQQPVGGNTACLHGDESCPCQDGDPCHYEWFEDTPPLRCWNADCTAPSHAEGDEQFCKVHGFWAIGNPCQVAHLGRCVEGDPTQCDHSSTGGKCDVCGLSQARPSWPRGW